MPLPGDLVRDRVTKLVGVVTARTQHLNMCDRYTVQPQVKEEGKGEEKLPAAYTIDVNDLLVVEENAIGVSEEERARWGTAATPEEVVPATGGAADVIEHEPVKRV